MGRRGGIFSMLFVTALLAGFGMHAFAQTAPPPGSPGAPAAPEKSANDEAMEFSLKGVGLLLHLAEGETTARYMPALRELMVALNKDGIPAHISGGTIKGDQAGLYFIVRRITWPVDRKQPYTLDEIRSGAVLQAISSVHARSRDDREFLKLLQEELTKRRDNIDAEIAELKARIKANEERIGK
jgi:hypothetical protein